MAKTVKEVWRLELQELSRLAQELLALEDLEGEEDVLDALLETTSKVDELTLMLFDSRGNEEYVPKEAPSGN